MVPRKRVGLKDVAALAGTSTATVSRVLNGSGYASPTMRQRVLAAAQTLHYEPSLRARGLRKQSSTTVGLIIPNLLNAYYTALADTVGQLLSQAGYSLLLASSRDEPLVERRILRDMVGHDVAGLLWVPTAPDPELLDYLDLQQVPVVCIVRAIKPHRVDTVVFEDFEGSRAATRHLLALGHRRIGYIGGDETHSSNQARWRGYQAALAEAGLAVDPSLARLGALRSAWGFAAATDLLGLADPPTALFIASNAIMPGAMRAIQQRQVAVPRDVSLVCFDDIEWFSFVTPPITAVSVSCGTLAETAAGLLLQRITDRDAADQPPVLREIPFELVVRGSSASPRSGPWHPPPTEREQPQPSYPPVWAAGHVVSAGRQP